MLTYWRDESYYHNNYIFRFSDTPKYFKWFRMLSKEMRKSLIIDLVARYKNFDEIINKVYKKIYNKRGQHDREYMDFDNRLKKPNIIRIDIKDVDKEKCEVQFGLLLVVVLWENTLYEFNTCRNIGNFRVYLYGGLREHIKNQIVDKYLISDIRDLIKI